MSKGSNRRPSNVSREHFDKEWARIFGETLLKTKEKQEKDIDEDRERQTDQA